MLGPNPCRGLANRCSNPCSSRCSPLHHWADPQWLIAPGKPLSDAANTPATRRTMLGPDPCRGAPNPCSSRCSVPRPLPGACEPQLAPTAPAVGDTSGPLPIGACPRLLSETRGPLPPALAPATAVFPGLIYRNFGSSGRTLESNSTPHAPSPQPPLL